MKPLLEMAASCQNECTGDRYMVIFVPVTSFFVTKSKKPLKSVERN